MLTNKHMNKTWKSPCGDIPKTLLFFYRMMKCTRLNSGVKTYISFHHTFCFKIFCRWCVKKEWKAGTINKATRCLKRVGLPATVQCVCQIIVKEGSCAGEGTALRGLNAGLSHSAVPGAAADTFLWLHTTCLRGFNHRRQTARGFTGRKHRDRFTLRHTGRLCRTVTDGEVYKCLMLQFILSKIIGES